MATTIKFTKMQGTGNDYIYVNTLSSPLQDPIKAARKWSAYHTGIGADGLVLIGASEKADFSMRIFNADGSEAMMCGNASRCIGKYVYEKGLTDKAIQYIKAREMILEYIRDRGFINNELVRELCGFSQKQARIILQRMRKENLIELSEKGRYAKYIIKK